MTFEEFIEEWKDQKPFIKVNTSGSTGVPKEIFLNKDFVKRSARRTIEFFNITGDSFLYSCVAPDYIGGKMMAVRACEANCRFGFESPSNRPLEKWTDKGKIDLLAVVPSQMVVILDHVSDLPEISNIIIGGGMIHPDLRKRIASSGLNCYETYGMTETASHIALRKVKAVEGWFESLEGIEVRLDDRGCLEIRFDTGERISTNDIAEFRDGKSFRISGRIDDVINTGGKKVNPNDIEKRIGRFLKEDFLITSMPDEKWGDKIIMIIEDPESKVDISLLEEKIKEELPSWQCPKAFKRVKKLERTGNGKIIRLKFLC